MKVIVFRVGDAGFVCHVVFEVLSNVSGQFYLEDGSSRSLHNVNTSTATLHVDHRKRWEFSPPWKPQILL